MEAEDAPAGIVCGTACCARIEADLPGDCALDRAVVLCAEAGLSPQIALDRMESQVNYFRASNPE